MQDFPETGLPLDTWPKCVGSLRLDAQPVKPPGCWGIDRDSQSLVWTDAMFSLYGLPLPSGDSARGDWLANVLPEDLAATRQAWAQALQAGAQADFVHRVMGADGSVRFVHVHGDAAPLAGPRDWAGTGTAQDVTAMQLRPGLPGPGDGLLQGIFAAMSEGLVIQGRDGHVLDANPAALVILGLSRDELMGRTSVDPRWQAVRPDGSPFPGIEHPSMVTLRTGQPQREQVMGVDDPRRGLRWLSINADPIWGADAAAPRAVVATFVDITERLALERQVAAKAVELQDLYDNAPCAYHSLDANGTFIRINATALRWMGCSADEVLGKKSPADFLGPQGREQFEREFARLKREGLVQGFETDLRTADGSIRRLSLGSTAVTDEQGRFVSSRSVGHDITALHQARERLKDLALEQSAMLDNDLIGIVRVRGRHFVWANAGMARIFGYPPDELIGLPTRTIYADDEGYRAIGEAVTARRVPGQHLRMQLAMRGRQGQALWIDMSSVLLSERTGESMAILVDITSLQRDAAKRLEIVKLAAENQQIRETSRLKSVFLANMSHELRTPLNTVTGYAHLLKAGSIGPESPKFDRYLAQIEASGHYLAQLIEGVLDFARIDSGHLTIHPAPVDLSALVQEVVDMLASAIASKHIQVSVTIDPGLGPLVADPLRIKQVLANFIANAVKFTPERGQVAVRATAHGLQDIRVEVEDNGIGIAEADQPRLFTEFQQLSAGSTKSFEGIGLGLALSRRLVEAHGGSLGVRSRLGVGSVFHFELPRRAVDAPAPPAAAGAT